MASIKHSVKKFSNVGRVNMFKVMHEKTDSSVSGFVANSDMHDRIKEWCSLHFGPMSYLFFISNKPRWVVKRDPSNRHCLVFFTRDADATLFKLGFTL